MDNPVSEHGAGLIELVAPGGVDEANHGTVRYRVDNGGHVRVPREAALYLMRYGGFRLPEPAAEVPAQAATPAEYDGDGTPAPRSGPPRPRKGA